MIVTTKGIRSAAARIDRCFLETPMRRSAELDRRLGCEFLFKDETATPIRSFKGRGACNHVAQNMAGGPLVCASAGNFGQGLAWAASLARLPLTVYAATNAVESKVEAMRGLGATVILAGSDFDGAKDAARDHAQRTGHALVEDGAHASIAEGAGTMAREAVEEAGPFDAWVTPLGNGALAAGTGTWIHEALPDARVFAVSAEGAPAMGRAVQTGLFQTTSGVDTIADGIAVRVPIASAIPAVRQATDEVIFVADRNIVDAMNALRDALDIVVEPAGAAGLAAVMADPIRWRGLRVAIPLCGGNV